MPYLSKREIESIAVRVVNAYRKIAGTRSDVTHRVCPEVLAHDLLGLNIVYRTLSADGSILGMTAFEPVWVQVYENQTPTYFPLDGRTILVESALYHRRCPVAKNRNRTAGTRKIYDGRLYPGCIRSVWTTN